MTDLIDILRQRASELSAAAPHGVDPDGLLMHAAIDALEHRAQTERAKIVAYLRETAKVFGVEIRATSSKVRKLEYKHHRRACTLAAKAIEDEYHLKGTIK